MYENKTLRVLVCIANHGTKNDQFLALVLSEYRTMSYQKRIVVLSNVPKQLGADVEVIVGCPTKDPWSLPFGHKRIFVESIEDFDLFIYSEDDILVTNENITAFLNVSQVLAADEIPGFFRFERFPDGGLYYPEVHGHYHWDPQSVRVRNGYTFAFFTNEHAGCYMLTRSQLMRAVASAGFLVDPHEGQYDLLVTAATDPYTQCGFTKLVCISHPEDFLVHHLPNKYLDRLGAPGSIVDAQIRTLIEMGNARVPAGLLPKAPQVRASQFGKNYYEAVRTDLIALIPETAQSVLSVGCGSGETEQAIARTRDVVTVPLDRVIAACARERHLKTVTGDLNTAVASLSGQTFDCVIVSNLLHLVPDPAVFLWSLAPVLSRGTTVIVTVPNLLRVPAMWRRLRRLPSHRWLGDYERSGVHLTSPWILRRWLRSNGLRIRRTIDVLPVSAPWIFRNIFSFLKPFLSCEVIAVAVCDKSVDSETEQVTGSDVRELVEKNV